METEPQRLFYTKLLRHVVRWPNNGKRPVLPVAAQRLVQFYVGSRIVIDTLYEMASTEFLLEYFF
jgi:hypothetical protein